VIRGLGLRKPLIAPHLVRPSFRLHAAARAGADSPVDLRLTGLIAAVKDQGQVGSCVEHSGSGATESQFALDGDPLGFVPSEDIGYKGARSIDRARANPTGGLPPLTDSGSMTTDYESWIATFGVAPRWRPSTPNGRNSDCDLDTVNDDIDLAAVESAGTLLAPGPYAIDPRASDAEALVQAALSANIVVRVDAFVDTSFEQWSAGSTPIPAPNENDPNGGGHAIYIVAWNVGQYVIRNSWGTSWGASGDAIVSSAWIQAAWGLYPWTVKRVAKR
jgi:hypothetical protein